MSPIPAAARQGLVQRALERLNLRFPTLFVIFLVLTVVDFLVPDPIPFMDEILLALVTLMLGLWKDRRKGARAPAQVVPPPPLPPPPPPGR